MVKAKVTYRSSTRHFRLEVDGHAGQAEPGHDIVCSAVSILTYTTAQVIQTMATNCYFPVAPTVELQSGEAVIDTVCDTEREYDEVRFATLFVVAGFALLQNQHPEYVQFIIDEA